MRILEAKRLIIVFLAISLLSLFADIVYEGARSISGAYLNLLAAPAIAAGVLTIGDLLSNVMRLVGGAAAYKASSGRIYWGLILLGYATNLLIPLLALTGSWEIALLLFFIERFGKGIRGPPRDVILAEITEEAGIGKGKGFGLHEFFDQLGAVIGPLIVFSMIFFKGYPEGYRDAFWIMWLPAILAICSLLIAIKLYPSPRAVRASELEGDRRLGRSFWIFLIGSMLVMIGLIHWAVISYYAEDVVKAGVIMAYQIPIFYLIAMAVDGAIAFPIGAVYDKVGIRSIIVAPISAIFIAPLLFGVGGWMGLCLAAVFWGFSMGIVETMMRAAVADLTQARSRSLAYGIYSFGIGLSWAISGILFSLLYQIGLTNLITAICITVELIAIGIFTALPKSRKT